MKTSRREFAALAASVGASLAVGVSPASAKARPWRELRSAYPQGVASGDPAPDSVILWTRREPEAGAAFHMLTVEVSPDPDFKKIAVRGEARVSAESDWTARVLAAGLKPGREYWYRFVDETGAGSRVGRTLTAPAHDDDRPIRFTFVSCQDVTQGACNAYRRMIWEDERAPADERMWFVLHLGDFIYEVVWYPEDSPGGVKRGRKLKDLVRLPKGEKMHDFHVAASLDDYRTFYRAYLTDPDLQDARARWPFVPVWDNHEFSWQGWQSQQVFDGKTRPAQQLKVAANQAWFEYQPARVRHMGGESLDRFPAPQVTDSSIGEVDRLGLGLDPNNLAAVRSLEIFRALRWGRNLELIITDNHSYHSEPPNLDAFVAKDVRWMLPEDAAYIADCGREANGGRPPETIRFDGKDIANPARNAPRQSHLGVRQKQWFLDRLKSSEARWKLWGHSFGTLRLRTDPQNLPESTGVKWPSDSYGLMNGGYFLDHGDIVGLVKKEGITGFGIVAGDRHSFWAGLYSSKLPPEGFDPVGVEFITGSISSQTLAEVAEQVIKTDYPLRPLYIHDRPDGGMDCALNMTLLHGVRASLKLKETGDPAEARKLSNPEVAPHLKFADYGGHGYAMVRVSSERMETDFVCIPRPLEPVATPDGGPLRYKVRHSVDMWRPGEPPRLTQQFIEGEAPLSI
jgi:alkaline phosphatase D